MTIRQIKGQSSYKPEFALCKVDEVEEKTDEETDSYSNNRNAFDSTSALEPEHHRLNTTDLIEITDEIADSPVQEVFEENIPALKLPVMANFPILSHKNALLLK